MPTTAQPSSKSKLSSKPTPKKPGWSDNALTNRQVTLGLTLLLMLAVVMLYGCAPQPVRVACDPYPALPESLRQHTSKNLDLVPSSMLPSRNVKPVSTVQ